MRTLPAQQNCLRVRAVKPSIEARLPKAKRGRTNRELRLAIGSRIAQRRREVGWLQKELAARIGVRLGRISQIETGQCAPSVGELMRLGEALGLSLDDLVKVDAWESARGKVMSLGEVLQMARIDTPEQVRTLASFIEALVVLFRDSDRVASDQAVAQEEGSHER